MKIYDDRKIKAMVKVSMEGNGKWGYEQEQELSLWNGKE